MLPIFTWETSSQRPVTIDIIHLWFHVAVLWCRDAWLCWLSWCCCKCSMAVIVISIDMLLYVYVDEKKTNVYYEKAVVADDWDENHSPKQSINQSSSEASSALVTTYFTMDLTSWCSSQSSKFVLLSPMLITITVMEHLQHHHDSQHNQTSWPQSTEVLYILLISIDRDVPQHHNAMHWFSNDHITSRWYMYYIYYITVFVLRNLIWLCFFNLRYIK